MKRFQLYLLFIFAILILPCDISVTYCKAADSEDTDKGAAMLASQPLDLVERASWALNGFMQKAPIRLPGDEGYYRVAFWAEILPHIRRDHAQWDLGDCTARAILSWTYAREMTGNTTTGLDVEQGQREYLFTCLHPENGLVYFSKPSQEKDGKYRYVIWDQSRTLRALVTWYRTRPEDRARLKPLIERMIQGLDTFATQRGVDEEWGPYSCWPGDFFVGDKPRKAFDKYNLRGALCVEPLVEYARFTGDKKALDLAIRGTNSVLSGHVADGLTPEQQRHLTFDPKDGSFADHVHGKTSSLIGIVKLARYLADHGQTEQAAKYLREARKGYDWLFAETNVHRGSRIGWIPERIGNRFGVIHETCGVADTIELAAAMAECADIAPEFSDWTSLHDDAESVAVNMLAQTQLRFTPEFEAWLCKRYGGGEKAEEQLKLARLYDGTWSHHCPPNDLLCWGVHLGCNGCCQYAGVRGLYATWCNTMTFDDGRLTVNYFLNKNMPQAVLQSKMPNQGEAEITLKEPAEVRIRIPSWLKAEQLKFTANGSKVTPKLPTAKAPGYLALGHFPKGTRIEIRFPLEERQTKERIAGTDYTIRWRGNHVVDLQPRGKLVPLFPNRNFVSPATN